MSATGDDDTVPSRSGPPLRTPGAHERYQPAHEIARGGMGRVVAAFDRELDRHVAVKEALADDADSLRRFAREIWITARLEHPAIVPIYDAGTRSDGTPFYVMRKIAGEPLVALVEASATFEERLALVPHVLAAARAIAHAHQRRVVHRDLKPGNILVGELGETVVIDWGLAKIVGERDDDPDIVVTPAAIDPIATRAGSVVGTPGFMPPEQAAGGEIDLRADVYALGATLYYVLSRRLPHEHTTTEELLHAVVHAPAKPIGELVPELPRDLAAIVDVAISPEPDRRYADAGAFAAELDSFLAGRLIASRQYTWRERLWRFVGRHRVAVTAVTVATLALVIGGAIALDRVLAARGRAEDALSEAVREREIAKDTVVTMTLDRARSLVETNPTAAVALVRPLATGVRWLEARAVVAEAEARGVAMGLPGPSTPARIAIAPEAPYAAASDLEGRVWLYDLANRTTTDLGRVVSARAELVFLDDRTLAIVEATRTTLIEPASGARRMIPVGGIFAGDGTRLVAQDAAGQLVEVDRTTGSGRALGTFVQDPVALSMSPGGTWVTARTPTGIAVLARATGRVAHELAVASPQVVWDRERDDRFVVRDHGRLTVVTIAPDGTLEKLSYPLDDVGLATVARGQVCFAGMRTMGIVDPSGREALPAFPDGMAIVATGAHGLCYGLAANGIAIAGDGAPRRTLASPIPLSRMAGSPRNPFVVAAGRDRVIAWRVPAPPREFHAPHATSIVPAGPRGVIVGGTTWRLLDLVTGRGVELPVMGLFHVTTDPTGRFAAFLEPRDRDALLTVVDLVEQRAAKSLRDDVVLLAAADRVAFVARDGRVVTIDGAGATTLEVRGTAAPRALHVAPGSLAVAWADRRIWVRDAHGTRTRPHDDDVRGLHAGSDGAVIIVGRSSIQEWYPDGRVVPRAWPSSEVVAVWWGFDNGARRIFVQLADGTLARVDLETHAVHRLAVVQSAVSVSANAARAVVGRPNTVQVLDLVAGVGWNLRIPSWPLPATLSGDGRWVAGFVDGIVRVLPIDVPDTPADLAARIDALTNAEIDPTVPSSVVGWRD